jgi:hypothetical protein
MRSKRQLLNHQRSWAESVGLDVDTRGYLDSVDANLLQPLSQKTKLSFENGSGSELLDTPSRPAKMKALHSSSALAVNVFDFWVYRDPSALLSALGLDSGRLAAITFEEQFPTGLKGNPPNLDVALEYSDGHVIGVESKFSEWLTPKSKNKAPFKPKYFSAEIGLWEDKGLPQSQMLAEAMHTGEEFFRHLDVPQLLKHVLGMANQLGGLFSLYYIYYDSNGPESDVHRQEVERFEGLVGDEVRFKARSYQELFSSLNEMGYDDETYMGYLHQRYFPEFPPLK